MNRNREDRNIGVVKLLLQLSCDENACKFGYACIALAGIYVLFGKSRNKKRTVPRPIRVEIRSKLFIEIIYRGKFDVWR